MTLKKFMATTYDDAGVHNDAKKEISRTLYLAAKRTWENRKGRIGEIITPFDDFSGIRGIDVSNLPSGTVMGVGFDGEGTRGEIAERVEDHRTRAHNVFAMVCDDAVIHGAEPVVVGSILDTNSLIGKKGAHTKQIRQLAEGYIDAAKEANVAVINGECAELGNRIGGYGGNHFALQLAHSYISVNLNRDNINSIKLLSRYLIETNSSVKKTILDRLDSPERKFLEGLENICDFNSNWGAAVVWFANKNRMITGKDISEGDYLVSLQERGFRSNGISLVRKILADRFGNEWHKQKFGESTYGQEVLTPSQIYTRAVVDMFGGFDRKPRATILGAAHITGGGIPEKIGRMLLPSRMSARLYSLIAPSPIVKGVQKLGNVSEEEAYKTWNMGNGMIIATPEPEKVIGIAKEHGIYAQVAGEIIPGSITEPKIIIESHASGPKKRLEFLVD